MVILCGEIQNEKLEYYKNCCEKISILCSYYFLTALNLNQYATSTAQPGLAVSKILNVYFPLSPLAEQERIVEKVEEIFKQIEVIQNNKEELGNLKLALKNKLLSLAIQGKLVKQIETDMPVAELLQKIQEEKNRLVKEKKIKKDKLKSQIYKKDTRWIEKIGDTEKDITNVSEVFLNTFT